MRHPSSDFLHLRVASAAAIAGGIAAAKESLLVTIPWTVVFVIAVIVGFVVSTFLERIFEGLFNTSQRLRSFLFGKDDIEGYWTDVIEMGGDVRVGVQFIRYVEDRYRIDGWQYDLDGKERITWTSIISEFDGDKLHYVYQADYHDGAVSRYGYSTTTFCRTSSTTKPDSAIGNFSDLGAAPKITFQCVRQSKEFVAAFIVEGGRAAAKLGGEQEAKEANARRAVA